MKITISDTYPDEILALQHFKGFHAYYEKLWFEGYTQQQAYEHTEEIHQRYYKYRKYSNFMSFRQVMYRK
jgi:hypothetical protein